LGLIGLVLFLILDNKICKFFEFDDWDDLQRGILKIMDLYEESTYNKSSPNFKEITEEVIKDVSFPSLTELAGVLKKKAAWGLQISGHTDNVGDDQKNMILSKKRAEAVRAFLVKEGIEEARFNVLFFGETMPIAGNETPEGRQKNRRVEMKIIFK
jgi:outer membrane protein OmpA-like peptidoglycan-associated protein